MSEKESKNWKESHSKAYIAMSLCIADGNINSAERGKISELCEGWLTDGEEASDVMKQAAIKMMKASKGVELLDGVNRCAKLILKSTDGSKKQMFGFLKNLKAIAEADKGEKPVSESEARIIRYVARGFGFGQKLSVELQDNSIGLIKN